MSFSHEHNSESAPDESTIAPKYALVNNTDYTKLTGDDICRLFFKPKTELIYRECSFRHLNSKRPSFCGLSKLRK